MILPIICAIVVIISTVAIKVLIQSASKKDDVHVEGVHMLPGRHWLFGHRNEVHGKAFFAHAHESGAFRDNGGLISCYFGRTPLVVVGSLKYARVILQSTTDRKSAALIRRHLIQFLGPKTILYLNGKEWRFYRSAVHRSFSPVALEAALKFMVSVGGTLAGSLHRRIDESDDDSITMEILPLLKLATTDIFCLAALREDLGGCKILKVPPLAKAFYYLSDDMARRMRSPFNPFANIYTLPSSSNRRYANEKRTLCGLLQQIVRSRKEEIAKQETIDKSRNDLLSHLLNAVEAQQAADPSIDSDMSDEIFSDILTTLLIAGTETTSITITYAIYLLAKNPQAEERCAKEVSYVFEGIDNNHVDNDSASALHSIDLDKLSYVRAVILEALRLYPPVAATNRCIGRDIKLGDVVIPKKTQTFVSMWAIHRDENVFPRPNEFLPERWVTRRCGSSENNGGGIESGTWVERSQGIREFGRTRLRKDQTSNFSDVIDSESEKVEDYDEGIPAADPNAFLAFSAGARSCVGRNFSMLESVSVLAVLLRYLKFETIDPDYEVTPKQSGLVQKPSDDLPMIIRKRTI